MSLDMSHETDAGPLLGTWRNTNPASRQIAGVRIGTVDGRSVLSVWGVSRPRCLDWGTVPIGHLYRGSPASVQAAAFEARFEFGPMTAVLEANVSKGLLIVACMKIFRDGSGRSSYFTREFFRKESEPAPQPLVPADIGRRPVTCADDERTKVLDAPDPASLDPGLFLGRWENTDAAARGIREVRMSEQADGLLLDLGFAEGGRCEVVGETFAEHAAGTAATQFHASGRRDGQQLRMHGWVKLGVLVIAVFRRPDGPGAFAPWFDREFFYRADQP